MVCLESWQVICARSVESLCLLCTNKRDSFYFENKIFSTFHIFTTYCICSFLLTSPFSTIQSKQRNAPPLNFAYIYIYIYIYMCTDWLQCAHTLIFTEILKLYHISPCVMKPSAKIITWQAIWLIKSSCVSCNWLIFFDTEYNNVS